MPPVKNPRVMTSYGGIIRIRLKGRSSVTSSQPASQAPLYLFSVLYNGFHQNATGFFYSSSTQRDAGLFPNFFGNSLLRNRYAV